MSAEAISHVWNATGVSAEEKLALLWIANSTGGLGYPCSPDWAGIGAFIGRDHYAAAEAVSSLIDKGLLIANETEGQFPSSLWLAYSGSYEPPINWTAETKTRSKRVASLIERDGPECTYCGVNPIIYHVDHFIPKSRGGADEMSNLVLACAPCNQAKGAMLPQVYLADRPELLRSIFASLGADTE